MKRLFAVALLVAAVACSLEKLPSAPSHPSAQKLARAKDSTWTSRPDEFDILNAWVASGAAYDLDSAFAAEGPAMYARWTALRAGEPAK